MLWKSNTVRDKKRKEMMTKREESQRWDRTWQRLSSLGIRCKSVLRKVRPLVSSAAQR